MKIITKVDLKPLSINKAYYGKLTKTRTLKIYENNLGFLLTRVKVNFEGLKLGVKITYGFSSRGSDLDNPQKPILDAISKKYGFNDNQIYDLHSVKTIVPKGKEFIKIEIRELEE